MSSSKNGQPPDHPAAVEAFLSLPVNERLKALEIAYGQLGFVNDEVVLAVARRAFREKWRDERRYSQRLLQRVYTHVRGHVGKNPAWVRLGGGLDATVDDCAAFVLEKLAAETGSHSYAEEFFGDFVYKRALDFVDTLFAKKRGRDPRTSFEEGPSDEEVESEEGSVLDRIIAEEEQLNDESKLRQIQQLLQEDGFFTEKESIAFTFRHLGDLQIHSKDEKEITVCKLMGCSEKSARIYVKKAVVKIKERLK